MKKNSGFTDLNLEKKWQKKHLELTSEYDQNIYNWFSKNKNRKDIKLRYGENPNQKAN